MFTLEICKQRAHEYLAQGDYAGALASFLSDLNKIPNQDYTGIQQFAGMLMVSNQLSNTRDVEKFIDGTN